LYTGSDPHNYKPSNYKWKVNPDSYRKEVCELCADKCPIGPGAISMERKKDPETGEIYNTPVIHAGCTGCGVCEMVCPVEPTAIVVVPGRNWSEKDA
jgi:ferredoxin-type protein NapG